MAQREKGGRVVFIGNIPYGVSEEQIMDIFGRAGSVVNFRLVYDKETGQPKGFGFLEYTDTDAAASAVRNLNEFDLNGRTLRVDYSNDNRSTNNSNTQNQNQNQDSNRAPPPAHFNMNGQPPPRPDPSALPQLPPGTELPPGVTAFDAISRTINNVPTPQLIDFISQLKGLCNANPGQATALLTQAPQLAYAAFQAMILLDLVDENVVQQLIATVPQAAPAPPQMQQAPPAMPPHGMPPPGYPPPSQQQFQAYPPQGPPMPPMPQGYPPGYGPQPGYAPTPPQQPTYQPPPQQAPPPQAAPPQAAPPQAAPPAAAADSQQALINQLMAMSRDDVMRIGDAAQRQQIINLRQQLGNPI
ncbi:Putative RNA recognition motif domain, nucleotide-binding alpha-beta plait domain superfamily [Septoria linicola]|uniref:RNA recognition motif domain, nucleotide-binding alpha-beta plait domain superfamily n=1 Tax=Septoria linicola TaxID=215465 RepID=A0A9Q9EN92_9PEZI|nr:putative RNA recognition motif domain, nucleotide-binding alpha-beta plait domain superfamily [Septoria linicola]USW56324.1 Putative RNA recognition motif domain, nucleotide-binding alpha-beta plait domain superfamily [Septoria linicola]